MQEKLKLQLVLIALEIVNLFFQLLTSRIISNPLKIIFKKKSQVQLNNLLTLLAQINHKIVMRVWALTK